MMTRTPLERIKVGAVVLAAVFSLSVIGYRLVGGYSWLDALWMVTITISTVGYGEGHSALPTSLQILTMLVIAAGISAAVYTFTGLFQLMIEGELEHILGRRKMTKEIKSLKDHTIICGYGRMGRNLAKELRMQGRGVVVIDSDAERVAEATAEDFLALIGDATEEETLLHAGLLAAGTLVSTFPSDADSVFITLTARNLNPRVKIIARAERETTEKKLVQAGADTVVMPTVVGAKQMGRMITRPTTAQLIRLVDEKGSSDFELDELRVGATCSLVKMSLEQAAAHRDFRVLVVAIKSSNGEFEFNPNAAVKIQADDELMVLGRQNDIASFREKYCL
ncbi:MAG: potassium channel family protein [Rubripirellula sp.]